MPKNRSVGAGASGEDAFPDPGLDLELLEAGPRPTAAAGETARALAAGGLRILVADQDPAVRAYIGRCLDTLPWPDPVVVEAGDGPGALGVVQHTPVHLVITEIALPRMSGLELLTALRADPAFESTPFILTAAEPVPRARRARIEGLHRTAVLEKPFNARKLRRCVEALLG